jgi:hypothetical protein
VSKVLIVLISFTHSISLRIVAGSGKSILTSSLIDEAHSRLSHSKTKTLITFFYCDYADKRTLDPINIFSSITKQVLQGIGELSKPMLELLESTRLDGKVPDVEEVMILRLVAIKNNSSMFIFIDGLDEVLERERKIVFNNLSEVIVRAASTSVKLFVASREDTSYLTEASRTQGFKIRIGADSVARDIGSYVKHTIRELIERRELVIGNPILEEEIFTALVAGAKGM